MRTLFILRHAKSSRDSEGLTDFERPLNGRGLKAAPFMGGLMREKGFDPSLIISSPAARARSTAELVLDSGNLTGDLEFDENIYEAGTETLREIISAIDDKHPSAMLVGHNPGMEGIIFYLTRIISPMPTAALALFELDIDSWSEVIDRCGKVREIFRPKDEMGR